MNATLTHRGPDDEGHWVDPVAGVALGFRRLSIVDLSPLGHQPMRSASGRFVMVFNGEVYNAPALATELAERGFAFRGHSDTEVMLAAFEHWGVVPALQRFVGMFAIALWDTQRRELHLVRDRLGIKPMFVHRQPGYVSFGSELKALLAGPQFDRSVDPESVALYLRFFYVPTPRSIFRSTSKLPPGTVLTIRNPNDPLPAPMPFWSAIEVAERGAKDPFAGDEVEAVDELERLLRESVTMRMVHADVPVGAFLSGGLDSSTVVALMQAASSGPVKTYTISFAEGEWNEAEHAAGVANHLGTAHTELPVSPSEAQAVVPSLSDMYDEPFGDISQVPTFLVSQLARREVTVALSGDGGDELFCGYNRYTWGERVLRYARRVPAPLRRVAGRALRGVPPDAWDRAASGVGLRARLPGDKMHKLGRLLATDSPVEFYRSLVSAWQEPEAIVDTGGPPPLGLFEEVLGARTPEGIIDRMMLADIVTYLPDNNLAKVDRASMAVSLEARVPIIDHRVVEFALRLPVRYKYRGGQTKWALRQVLYRHVPRALVEREKMGFDVPIGEWLRGPLQEWAGHHLAAVGNALGGMLDQRPVQRVWNEHLEGSANHGRRLWVLLMLLAWEERWLA